MVKPELLKRVAWRSIGPATMAGRVSCIAFAPGDSKTFYIGYATGGVWKTTNRGVTIKPIFDNEETCCIGSIAVCDAHADWQGWSDKEREKSKSELAKAGKGKVVWIGTGEGNGRNSSSWGHGVYRSTDAGKSWSPVGLEDSHEIPKIAADPRNPDVCYAACLGHLWGRNKQRGLFKTSDGGKSWKPVLQIDQNTGCCDVLLDPKSPDTVYCAMYDRLRTPYSFTSGGPEGGIYKSTDGGRRWRKLAGGLPEQTGRIGLDIHLKNPKILVACVESREGGTNDIRDDRSKEGGVFRTEDGGETWERLSQRAPRAFYFSKIRIDPKDPKRVYNLGWFTERSDDGGNTFRGDMGEKMHVDMHDLVINPDDPDHLINGSDGGAYQSFDRGESWQFLNTHAVGQFYNVSVERERYDYRVAGGLQDNGSWIGPSRTSRDTEGDATVPPTAITNADWEFALWGDGFHADFDPTDSDVVYCEWQGGNITRINLKTGERMRLAPQQAEGGPRFRFNWNAPFFVSEHDPTRLYIGGNYVFRMTERGDRWERISEDLSHRDIDKVETVGSVAETYGTVVALAESPLKPGALWAGTDDGRIHITRNDGGTWTEVTPASVKGRYVSRIDASHAKAGRAYATIDGHRSDDMGPHVLVTEDWGKSWKDCTGDLPRGWSAIVVREDESNPDVLYCGTENGFYVSWNRGRNWSRLHGENLPTTPVYDIKQHEPTGDLVIATHGRSIWILDGASWIGQVERRVLESDLALFEPPIARPRQMMFNQGYWTDQMFRAANPPKWATIDYWVGEFTGEKVKIEVLNSDGLVVRDLPGSNAPGFHRVVWDCKPYESHRRNDDGADPMMSEHFVADGEYTVRITMGDLKAETRLSVLRG